MSANLKKSFKLFCIFLCCFVTLLTNNCGAKPTITFTLPPSLTSSLPSFSSYTRQFIENKQIHQMKSYSGHRQSNDTLIMIYHHDSTVAIVELGLSKLLLGCELIEIYNDNEGKKLLKELSTINRPLEITFKEMLQLMEQCEIVDKQNRLKQQNRQFNNIANRGDGTDDDGDDYVNDDGNVNVAGSIGGGGGGGSVSGGGGGGSVSSGVIGLFPQNPFTLLSGIIPGTKWCGTGDIANTYSDLGTETVMDRCCRTHDLCPIKVRAYQRRYKLNNNSLYTKSHCTCDDMLYSCLKKTNTSAAQVMGSIYFNLVQVPCILDTPKGATFRKAREGF